MHIGVAGSVAIDQLMTFDGKFADSFVEGSLDSLSLSFLVSSLEKRRGGCAANISFGMAALGLNPVLIASVGVDWPDYDAWLKRHGVDTQYVNISDNQYTATFIVTTDTAHNQLATFYPGAASEARGIELSPIMERSGAFDLVTISPDDPEAMIRHSEACRSLGIPFGADPSQQLAYMSGPDIKKLIMGAKYLFLNEYELALTLQKTGWSDQELFEQVQVRITTFGSQGSRIEEHGKETITVSVPQEKAKVDPTGVGDNFRAGFLAGISWKLEHERAAQIGSMLATYCLETKGTQEYRFSREEFLERFSLAYGDTATDDIRPHLVSRLDV